MPKRKHSLILVAVVSALLLLVQFCVKPTITAHKAALDRRESTTPSSAERPAAPSTQKPLNLLCSIVPVDTTMVVGELTPEEWAAPLAFSVGLRM